MLHSRTGPWYGVIEQSISVSVRPAGAPTRPAWVVSAPQRICVTRTIALSLVASLIHTAAYCRGTTLCRYTQAQLPRGSPISRLDIGLEPMVDEQLGRLVTGPLPLPSR